MFSEDESNKLLAKGPRGHELHFCKTELVGDHWNTSVWSDWPHFSRAFEKYPKPFLLLVASDQRIYSCFASFSSQLKSLHESEEILKGFHSSCQDDMALESVAVSASVALPFQSTKVLFWRKRRKIILRHPKTGR